MDGVNTYRWMHGRLVGLMHRLLGEWMGQLYGLDAWVNGWDGLVGGEMCQMGSLGEERKEGRSMEQGQKGRNVRK